MCSQSVGFHLIRQVWSKRVVETRLGSDQIEEVLAGSREWWSHSQLSAAADYCSPTDATQASAWGSLAIFATLQAWTKARLLGGKNTATICLLSCITARQEAAIQSSVISTTPLSGRWFGIFLHLRQADSKHWAYLQEHILHYVRVAPVGIQPIKRFIYSSATQPPMGFSIKHKCALHIRTDTKAQSAKSSFHHGDWLHLICN